MSGRIIQALRATWALIAHGTLLIVRHEQSACSDTKAAHCSSRRRGPVVVCSTCNLVHPRAVELVTMPDDRNVVAASLEWELLRDKQTVERLSPTIGLPPSTGHLELWRNDA